MINNLLQNKKGIIFGALNPQSIAWEVALQCHQQGAQIVLTNAPVALRIGNIHQLSQQCNNAPVIPADVTNITDIENLFTQATAHFGSGIDFILHSVGMSYNVRKNKPYTEVSYDFYQKTLDISAISLHKILQTAYHQNALNEWASVVALTYIAAQRTLPNYNDMADAKATLESIARSFGYYYGLHKKVRINTLSQSPTLTTAGSGIQGFDKFYEYANQLSPLGNAPAQACAQMCVALFSDLTQYVTMQNLYHDGGFSSTGMSQTILNSI